MSTNQQKDINLGRGAGYGMDAALDEKRNAKYDVNAEQNAQRWIEDVVGEQFEESFGDSLKSGIILCKLINKIRPKTVKKINKMKMPFMQMENIAMFLQGCRVVGVADHDCFETVDLYEQKDLGVVVSCLHALGRAVQKNLLDWNGPTLGPKEAQKNVRNFTKEQMNLGKGTLSIFAAGSSETMEKIDVTKTGITFGADKSESHGDNTMTLFGLGSKDIMERAPIQQPGITFGADNAGASSYGDNNVPLLGLGSKDIMERQGVTKTGITFGADNAGGSLNGADNNIPLLGLGSKDIMERQGVTKPGITFGADASSPKSDEAIVTAAADDEATMTEGAGKAYDVTTNAALEINMSVYIDDLETANVNTNAADAGAGAAIAGTTDADANPNPAEAEEAEADDVDKIVEAWQQVNVNKGEAAGINCVDAQAVLA